MWVETSSKSVEQRCRYTLDREVGENSHHVKPDLGLAVSKLDSMDAECDQIFFRMISRTAAKFLLVNL